MVKVKTAYKKNKQKVETSDTFWLIVGVVGLCLMMLAWLYCFVLNLRASEAARGLEVMTALGIVMIGIWLWLPIGVICLIASKNALVEYKPDLKWIGIFSIVGVVTMPVMYIFVLPYFSVVFGYLIYRAYKRDLSDGKMK